MRRRFVGLERDREEEPRLRVEKVAAVGVDLREHRVRLADVGIEHQRLPRRGLGETEELLLVTLFLRVAGHHHVARRERSVRAAERRVVRERRLVQLDRTLQVFLAALLPDRPSLQVELVGLDVLRGRLRALRELLFLGCELDAQPARRSRWRSRPAPGRCPPACGRRSPTRGESRISVSISCAVMRTWSPACRTLPSSTVSTPSSRPTWRMSTLRPLYAKAEVREATCSPGTRASRFRSSSDMPSLK